MPRGAPPFFTVAIVRTRQDGFDWGTYAMRWWVFWPFMLLHYDWTLHAQTGNRWALLWFRSDEAADEFTEGSCK